ncbi:mycothiol system anti-sigma-R factor [Kocuria coralli]|uniref:Mycothiol system anti-sigma-R factor n=1 Tax=Kocuria coralli TaxID=1461025 RepID=A0A5J5L3G2_9MICC|nr:mycothiol system anti-sigma-R factor [Kocuria coralli]KAA9395626.1 mycothiol system anti-sigma-R factor [Kocuria coralli]
MTERAARTDIGAAPATTDQAPCGCDGEQVERIYAYLDDALTVEDIKQIADHLESCADCTHESELEQVIRGVVKRSCSETAPETLRSAIMTRIHEQCGQKPQ